LDGAAGELGIADVDTSGCCCCYDDCDSSGGTQSCLRDRDAYCCWGHSLPLEITLVYLRAMDSVILAQADEVVVVEVSAVLLAMLELLVDDGQLDSHLDYYGEQQYSEVAEVAASSAAAAQDGH